MLRVRDFPRPRSSRLCWVDSDSNPSGRTGAGADRGGGRRLDEIQRRRPSSRALRSRVDGRGIATTSRGTPASAVVIDRLEIETGITDDDEWRLASKAAFNARIDVAPTDSTTHAFLLAAVDDESGFDIASGTFDATSGGFALRTDDVDLRRASRSRHPATAGAVISAMEIDGALQPRRWSGCRRRPVREARDRRSRIQPPNSTRSTRSGCDDEGFIVDEDLPPPDRALARRDRAAGDVLEISGRGGRLGRTEEPDLLPDFGLTVVFRLQARRVAGGHRAAVDRGARGIAPRHRTVLPRDRHRSIRPAGRRGRVPVVCKTRGLRVGTASGPKLGPLRHGLPAGKDRRPPPAVGEEIAEASLDLRDGEGMYKGSSTRFMPWSPGSWFATTSSRSSTSPDSGRWTIGSSSPGRSTEPVIRESISAFD